MDFKDVVVKGSLTVSEGTPEEIKKWFEENDWAGHEVVLGDTGETYSATAYHHDIIGVGREKRGQMSPEYEYGASRKFDTVVGKKGRRYRENFFTGTPEEVIAWMDRNKLPPRPQIVARGSGIMTSVGQYREFFRHQLAQSDK